MELRADNTTFLIIDVQERLAQAMPEQRLERTVKNLEILGEASRLLQVPVVATEQYPKGLGSTLPLVRNAFSEWSPLEKVVFDCCKADGFALDTPNVVVAGMETHVCVYQTVRTLCARGHKVHVLADAVTSRSDDNRAIGMDLMARCGGIATSTEVVVFDLLGQAGSPEFKTLSKLLR